LSPTIIPGRRAARFAATALLLTLALGALAACNTISGAGKDVSAAGDAVTGTSDATKAKLPSAPSP
jgi:predicted small secreted protein